MQKKTFKRQQNKNVNIDVKECSFLASKHEIKPRWLDILLKPIKKKEICNLL